MHLTKYRVEEFSEKMIAKTNTLTKLRVRRKKAEQLQHRRQKERKDKEQHTFSSFFSSSSFTSTSSTNGYLNRGIIATREADNIAADNNRIVNGGGTECRHDSRSVLVLPTSEDMISELVPSLTSYQEQEDRDITFLTTLSHRIEVSSSSSSSSSSTIFPTLSRSFFMKHDHILLLNTIDQVNNYCASKKYNFIHVHEAGV